MQNLEKGNLPESQGNNQLDNNQAGNLQPDKPISPGFYFTFILFRYKYLIIFLVVAATVTSIFIAKSLPNMYSSTASLVPPKGTGSMLQGALGSISTALKDIGVTKLGSKGDLSYSFIVLLDNRTVKDSIISKFKLAEVYEMQNEKPTSVRAAFNENLLLKVTADGNYTITVTDKDPQRACDIAKAYAGMVDSVASELFQRENRINRIHLENRIKQTDSVINELSIVLTRYSKNKAIIEPESQSKYFVQELAALQSEKVKQEISLEIVKNRYGDDDATTLTQKKLVDELTGKIQNILSEPGFAGNFSLNDVNEVAMNYLRLYTEYITFTKVKAFLLPMLEEARIEEAKASKTLYMLDEPLVPDGKSKPKRSMIVTGTCLGSFFLAILFVFSIEGIIYFRKRYKQAAAILRKR